MLIATAAASGGQPVDPGFHAARNADGEPTSTPAVRIDCSDDALPEHPSGTRQASLIPKRCHAIASTVSVCAGVASLVLRVGVVPVPVEGRNDVV
jgi:hypothetical protein